MTSSTGYPLLCKRCGREWLYTGVMMRATCPKCHGKVSINSKARRYMIIDFEKHGQGIINALKSGKKRAILDCLGDTVVDVSIVD